MLTVALLDELTSGVPVVGAADVRADFGLCYAALAAALLVLPMASALFLDAPLFAWSDRHGRKGPAIAAGLVCGASLLGVALAPSSAWLAVALGVWGLAGGLQVGLAEAALIDRDPAGADLAMTRWTLMGAIGDAAAPLVFAVVVWLGLGWRGATLAVATATLVHAVVLAVVEWPPRRAETEGDDEEPRDSLAALRKDHHLGAWLLVAATCTLLDEVIVVFGTLHLHENLGADGTTIGVAWFAYAVAGVSGLAVVERVLPRLGAGRVLALASAGTLGALAAWLAAATSAASVALLAVLGLCAAPLWALAKARAYDAAPDRPGLVNAIGTLFVPVEIVAPVALGLVAARFGLVPALALLAVEPLAVLVALRFTRPARSP